MVFFYLALKENYIYIKKIWPWQPNEEATLGDTTMGLRRPKRAKLPTCTGNRVIHIAKGQVHAIQGNQAQVKKTPSASTMHVLRTNDRFGCFQKKENMGTTWCWTFCSFWWYQLTQWRMQGSSICHCHQSCYIGKNVPLLVIFLFLCDQTLYSLWCARHLGLQFLLNPLFLMNRVCIFP